MLNQNGITITTNTDNRYITAETALETTYAETEIINQEDITIIKEEEL